MADLFIERNAFISDCGKYRYLLLRVWNHERQRALFIMLNPSTADASIDDPTIRSCIRLCRALAFGGFEVVNLFGWRASDPNELGKVGDPIGPDNDKIAERAIARCDVPICAWGAHWSAYARGQRMMEIIRSVRRTAFCLGKTKSGNPKHPLYIKTGTALEVFLG